MSGFWSGKRVLVTGHTGFKGSWLCEILLKLGAIISGYSLPPETSPSLYELCGIDNKISSYIADIRDFSSLNKAYIECKPEIVFHLAAQPLVLRSYSEPKYTFETNVIGTVNLLECVRNCSSVRSVVNVTTDKVYLNLERKEGYCEDDKLCGYDPYANSKSCSELVTYSYKQSFLDKQGVSISTARSGNVIGGGDFSDNRIIPDCVRFAKQGKTIELRSPKSIRPYQHVLDTLFAYLLIAEKQYTNQDYADSYNIGPNDNDCITSGELTNLFCDEWGNGANWKPVETQGVQHESTILKLDCSKINSVLSWKPRWNINTAVKKVVDWEKANINGLAYEKMQNQIGEFI